ncbi:universal stress protein [Gammaproteobacteria bacterium]|nr:universal stress protein [Gammaproteobacteria bacterium]
MSQIYVVGVDASESSFRAAEYAQGKAKAAGATLHVIHVLEWSPYTFLTPEELEERRGRRREELSRAKSAVLEPMVKKLGDDSVVTEARFGQIADVINTYASEVKADQVFIGRHGGSEIGSRLFGSVPGTLVQIADTPVTVVP